MRTEPWRTTAITQTAGGRLTRLALILCRMRASNLESAVRHATNGVRHMLGDVKNEPVGVLTAYKLSVLRLVDAIDRLAGERGSPTKPS